MRLSFLAATLLLAGQFTQTVGFSILLTTSPRGTTSLFSAVPEAPPAERKKPLTPAELVAKSRKAAGLPEQKEAEASKLFDESLYDDMQQVLLTLEKRVREGAGSLSLIEVEQIKTGSDRILEEMKQKEAERVASLSAAAAPAEIASVEPAPVEAAPADPAPVAAVQEVAAFQENPTQDTPAKTASAEDYNDLRVAVSLMDVPKVSALLKAGLQMDEETTNAAFWEVVKAVDIAEQEDKPLSGDIPTMLHHIFKADHRHLLTREQIRTNVTCKQPEEGDDAANAQRMAYIFDDAAHKDIPLSDGRCCEGGTCSDGCSRNLFPTFATEHEINFQTFPDIESFSFNNLRRVNTATIIQFTRLVERVRRTIAHEYGVPLSSVLPLQAYTRKYVAGMTQQGGGGGEGDFVTLHTDEATHSGYHYSCVMYMSTQGEDFEGGDFVWNDPEEKSDAAQSMKDTDDDEDDDEDITDYLSLEEKIRRAGRKLIPYGPTRGAAVIFSSGWENMHEVEKITSGTRYAVPCFFTTCPVPEAAYEQMAVGKPKSNEDIADDWLHLLLAHRQETPQEGVGRVKELLMKWHCMCAPLSEH